MRTSRPTCRRSARLQGQNRDGSDRGVPLDGPAPAGEGLSPGRICYAFSLPSEGNTADSASQLSEQSRRSEVIRLTFPARDFSSGSIAVTNRRDRNGSTCFDTGHERSELLACVRFSNLSMVGGVPSATGGPQKPDRTAAGPIHCCGASKDEKNVSGRGGFCRKQPPPPVPRSTQVLISHSDLPIPNGKGSAP
jgi:hypothetical protein